MLLENTDEYIRVYNLVNNFFNNDIKANLFMKTKNPLLGNMSPVEMIIFGRTDKLIKVITSLIEDNKP
jgi:uncharacterized protein (DUF2384 family)